MPLCHGLSQALVESPLRNGQDGCITRRCMTGATAGRPIRTLPSSPPSQEGGGELPRPSKASKRCGGSTLAPTIRSTRAPGRVRLALADANAAAVFRGVTGEHDTHGAARYGHGPCPTAAPVAACVGGPMHKNCHWARPIFMPGSSRASNVASVPVPLDKVSRTQGLPPDPSTGGRALLRLSWAPVHRY